MAIIPLLEFGGKKWKRRKMDDVQHQPRLGWNNSTFGVRATHSARIGKTRGAGGVILNVLSLRSHCS